MKRYPILVIGILIFFLTGCANIPVSKEDKEAQLREGGEIAGIALAILEPGYAKGAKLICNKFLAAERLVESEVLFNKLLLHFSGIVSDKPRVQNGMKILLKRIGFSSGLVEDYVHARIDSVVEKEGFTEETLGNARIALEGFCEVLP